MTRPSDRAIAQAELPNAIGWCRVKNGQYEVQIGGERPHDRGNGNHSPWASLYDNPALRAYGESCVRAAAPDGAQAVAWRCFYCDESFTDRVAALEHFGPGDGYTRQSRTACQIDIAEYRRMVEKEARYAEEDAEVHRSMHRMAGEHQQALQRAEESGYARGLRDPGQCPCASPPAPGTEQVTP